MRVHRDDAPVRKRPVASGREIQVDAGVRIEEQVHVFDNVLLVRALAVDVVGRDGRRGVELPLNTDGALERPRQVNELRRPDEFLEVADETSGRVVVGVTEPRDRLRVGRQRLTVGRVRRKVRTAVIRVADDGDLRIARRKRLIGAQRIAVVQPDPAARDGLFVHFVGKAEPRLEVGFVGGTSGLLERREADVVRKRTELQVVSQPEIQCQVARHLPVVLRPRSVCGGKESTPHS